MSARNLICMCAALCLSCAAAHGGFDYDGFDYTGTSLLAQNGGSGWGGAWFNTASTSDTLSNDGVSLQFAATFESPLITPTPVGSRIKTGGIGASSSRLLSSTVSLAVEGNVLYASALIRKNVANGATNNDNILLEFSDSLGNRRFGLGIEGTGDKPWLNANGSTTPSAGPAVTVGDTYFIVAKIVASATGLDTAYLKVFGTGYGSQVPAAEPSTWDATLTQTTSAVLDRVRVRIDAANSAALPGEVDEIRIGPNWQEVVGTPEPGSLSMLSLTMLLARRRRR